MSFSTGMAKTPQTSNVPALRSPCFSRMYCRVRISVCVPLTDCGKVCSNDSLFFFIRWYRAEASFNPYCLIRSFSFSIMGTGIFTRGQKKWVSYLHRTATTTYPCFLPDLGDSAGAGRIRLTRHKVNKSVQLAVCSTQLKFAINFTLRTAYCTLRTGFPIFALHETGRQFTHSIFQIINSA